MKQERTVSLKELAAPARQKPTFFTKANTATPKARVQGKPDGWDWGFKHAVYVAYFGKAYANMHYSSAEVRALQGFVKLQDEKHEAKRRNNGAFAKVMARISKVHPSTPAYAEGSRWQYSTGSGNTFRQVAFVHLDDMLAALDKALV